MAIPLSKSLAILTQVAHNRKNKVIRAFECQRAILLDERWVADDLTHRILSDIPLLASHSLAPPTVEKR